MKIIFTDQYSNLLFLINGLAIVLYLAAKKKKRQRAMKFGNYKTLQKVAGKNFLKSNNILLIIKLMALTSLVIGISNPTIEEEAFTSKSDYVIAIDSSSSMLSSDLEPNRFESAKATSQNFVNQLSNETKIGVITFAGDVNEETKLTKNKEKVKRAIEQAEIGSEAGTAIGDSLFAASTLLLGSNNSKTVILITDGRNNVGSKLEKSKKFAANNNVTVNTIGLGDKNRESNEFGVVNGNNASKAQFPNLNTENLYNLSDSTGGKLITVSDSRDLKEAFIQLEKDKIKTDISKYFIYLAAFLILIEWALGTTKYSILP